MTAFKQREHGRSAAEVIRELGVAERAFYRWKLSMLTWNAIRPSNCGSCVRRMPGFGYQHH